jgi:hypothetical protein
MVISCAGDTGLAHEVFDYLLVQLRPVSNNINDIMTPASDEIEIVNRNGISDNNSEKTISEYDVRKALDSLLQSDPTRFNKYTINELDNVFTIGINHDLLKDMQTCEYCGYQSKDANDMYNHRFSCFAWAGYMTGFRY